MKSLVDVRVFAVENAVKIAGPGSNAAQIVACATEIERYIVGSATLPEVAEGDLAEIGSVLSSVLAAGAENNTQR